MGKILSDIHKIIDFMHLNMNQVSHTIVMNSVGLVDRQVRFFKIHPHYSVHDSFFSFFFIEEWTLSLFWLFVNSSVVNYYSIGFVRREI